MTTVRRSTALAIALFALSAGVSAAPTFDLDFEAEGKDAVGKLEPVKPTALKGLKLSGAWGYGWNMLIKAPADIRPEEFDEANPKGNYCGSLSGKCNEGGFLLNRDFSAGKGSSIVLSVDEKLFPSGYFKSITLDLFTNTDSGLKLTATGRDGKTDISDNFGAGSKAWQTGQLIDMLTEFDTLGEVVSLEFSVGASTLGLDNMAIVMGGVTVPVPEPAGYGLVGLALLAAGAASRRRS